MHIKIIIEMGEEINTNDDRLEEQIILREPTLSLFRGRFVEVEAIFF